jgi:hypothetical protein
LPHRTPALWFDISQFSQPTQYIFGNTPRTLNGLRNDGVRNLDIGLEQNHSTDGKTSPPVPSRSVLPIGAVCSLEYEAGRARIGMISAMENLPRVLQFLLKFIY